MIHTYNTYTLQHPNRHKLMKSIMNQFGAFPKAPQTCMEYKSRQTEKNRLNRDDIRTDVSLVSIRLPATYGSNLSIAKTL